MSPSNKLLASVAGVSIASAVVVGAMLGAAGGDTPAQQQPVGNHVGGSRSVTPSSSPSASRVATVVAKVSPSKSTLAVHSKPRQVVANQEPAVTDPTSTPPRHDSTLIDQGSGTVDAGGVRRAPAPTGKHSAPPEPPAPPNAPLPSAS